MDISAIKFFKKLKDNEQENTKCFDCQKDDPRWASVSHGTIICLMCSGSHRSLGSHISFTRSLTMDQWSEQQMLTMSKGGNKAAAEFFKKEGLFDLDISKRYYSRAAKYYRQLLAARAAGMEEPAIPYAQGEGTELVQEDVPNVGNVTNSTSDASRNIKNGSVGNDYHEGVGSQPVFPSDPEQLLEAATDIFNNAFMTASQYAGQAKEAVNNGTVEEKLNTGLEKAQKMTSKVYNTLTDEKNFDDIENKLAAGANAGWGFMKGVMQFGSAAFTEATKMAADVAEHGLDAESIKIDNLQKLPSHVMKTVGQQDYQNNNENYVNNNNIPAKQTNEQQPSADNTISSTTTAEQKTSEQLNSTNGMKE